MPGAAVAAAASAGTLFVSPAASGSGAESCCPTASYSAAQAAVNAAASGSEVYLCGTTPFVESILIQDKQIGLPR